MLRVRKAAIRSTWEEGRIGIREMSRSFSQSMEFSCDHIQASLGNIETRSRSWSDGSLDSHIGLLAKKLLDMIMKIDMGGYTSSMADELASWTHHMGQSKSHEDFGIGNADKWLLLSFLKTWLEIFSRQFKIMFKIGAA